MTADEEFSHDHDHEEAHDHKTDGSEGEWVSSEPPVDDFGDDPQAEGASVSKDDDHEGEDSMEPVVEQKRKSVLPLLIVAVVILGGLGGAGYWLLAGHKDDQASVLDAAARKAAKEAMPNFASKPAPATEKPTATGAIASPTTDVAPKTSYSAPMNASDYDAMNKKPVPKPTTESAAAPAAWPTTVPSPEEPATKQEAQAQIQQPIQQAQPAQPQPDMAQLDNQAQEQKITALNNRIDELQKSLGQATQQLSQVTEKLAKASVSDQGASANQVSEERIKQLEQKILQLEQQPKAVSGIPVHDNSVESVIPQNSKKFRSEMALSHHHKHHKVAKAAKKGNSWVLRAATPDEAWVAKSGDARELRPVHVGDTLENVGQVTAIQQVGKTWVVQGTRGTVR